MRIDTDYAFYLEQVVLDEIVARGKFPSYLDLPQPCRDKLLMLAIKDSDDFRDILIDQLCDSRYNELLALILYSDMDSKALRSQQKEFLSEIEWFFDEQVQDMYDALTFLQGTFK